MKKNLDATPVLIWAITHNSVAEKMAEASIATGSILPTKNAPCKDTRSVGARGRGAKGLRRIGATHTVKSC